MSRNRRDWSNLSSLARQRTLEDEEELEREQRRRNRNLSSTTDIDTSVSMDPPATEQQSAEERVQTLEDPEPQEVVSAQDDDQEFLELLKKRDERKQRRQVEILQCFKTEQQNGDSESGGEQQEALEPKTKEREEKHEGELKIRESKQRPGEQQHVGEPRTEGGDERLNGQKYARELKSGEGDQKLNEQKSGTRQQSVNELKHAGELKNGESKQKLNVGEQKSGTREQSVDEQKNGERDQKLNEKQHMGEQKRQQSLNEQKYAGELKSRTREQEHNRELKTGGREQKPGDLEHRGEPKGIGREKRLNEQENMKEPNRDGQSKSEEHQDSTPKEDNVPSNTRNSGDTAMLSTPANERDHSTKQINNQMTLEGSTNPLSPTQTYRSQVFVSSMKISRAKGATEVGWKSLDGMSPGVTDEDGKKPSALETKGKSVQRSTSLKQCLKVQLSPVGEERKEMGTEHQNMLFSGKDGPVDAGVISPRATTDSTPLRRLTPRTSSVRIMTQKEQPECTLTRSASMRISSRNSRLDERLEKYVSAVQKSEMIKPPMSTKKDFISLPTGINNKRNIFEKEANSSGVTSPTSKKESPNTSGRVASRINQLFGKIQEESSRSKETKDERKGNISAKRSLWEQPGSSVAGKP